MLKKLQSLLRIASLALLLAGVASAQTNGTIIGVITDASSGKPVAGAVVIATSPNLQGQQTAVTDNAGNFRITLLPPGEYALTVQLGGYKDAQRSDIRLSPDKTLRANMAVVPESVQMEEQVVRTGTAPVVNIGSAEAGAVVSREFVSNIPVGRTAEQVSVVVPTAQGDFYGVGFAGAQSPENAYVLDGLNITDPVYGTAGANTNSRLTPQSSLLTNFIQEIDVKTGGFMPEYGRATGGILNMVTRSGSNEFHGSLFGNFSPHSLIQPTGTTAGAAGEAIAFRSKPSEGAYEADFGFEVGGPIQKDKLWFYAGFAPILNQRRTERFLRTNVLATPGDARCDPTAIDPKAYGRCIDSSGNFIQNNVPNTSEIVKTGRTSYQFVGKLTYLLDENNSFTVSGYGTPSKVSIYSMNSAAPQRTLDTDDNVLDFIGRYAGKFLDKRLVTEAVAGFHSSSTIDQPTAFQENTSTLRYREDVPLSAFETGLGTCTLAECPVFSYRTGGLGFLNDQRSNRIAGKVSAAYLFSAFGSHAAKVGLDVERSQYKITKDYGGNTFLDAFPSTGTLQAFRAYGSITDASSPTGFTVFEALSTTSYSTSTGVFVQDSWQLPVANLTLNAGMRWEGQTMRNQTSDVKGFSINNNWAPRLHAIWDFTGNGRGKVAGSWGRFFYNIPLDMGDRAFGNETQVTYRFDTAGCAPAFSETNPAAIDPTAVRVGGACTLRPRSGTAFALPVGAGLTPVQPDLQGIYVDQFGAQAEYEIFSDLSVGLEYNGRRQGQTIEDMSPDDGGHYFIGNPGYGDPFRVDPDTGAVSKGCSAADIEDGNCLSTKGVTTLDNATGRTLNIAFPKPERSYDGFTLFVRKNFSRNWQASVSYTYSYLRGNLAGPFRSEDNQLDPGVTSEYDLASLMGNRFGYLPGDSPHQLKLFGSYTFNFGPRMSANLGAAYTGRSGQPVSVLGGHPLYGDSQSFILPRGMGGRSEFLNQIDVTGGFNYVIKAPYALNFTVAVFNLFDSQGIEVTDQDYTFDAVQPIVGANCNTKAPSKGNPASQLARDCPELAFLKTVDGRPATINPNWGRASPAVSAFQIPLSLRLGVALTF